MGYQAYRPLAERFHVPIVVTGFEPTDLLQGILQCVRQLEQGRAEVENAYGRAVLPEGNVQARDLIAEVFTIRARKWRGIGEIPASGFGLAPAYEAFDAERRFELSTGDVAEDPDCIAGLVLQGVKKPVECPSFGVRCNPSSPLGAPMVSSEGACSAYHRYRRVAS
jgi:hydrogenase expression/formation protein HypD